MCGVCVLGVYIHICEYVYVCICVYVCMYVSMYGTTVLFGQSLDLTSLGQP